MKLIIPLLFICNLAMSQAQDVHTLIQTRANVYLYRSDSIDQIVKDNARHLIVAYSNDAPEDLQMALDNINDSWFNDVDVFVGDDLDMVMEYIGKCDTAFFLEHKGRVVIDVTETQKLCMVTVYTIP